MSLPIARSASALLGRSTAARRGYPHVDRAHPLWTPLRRPTAPPPEREGGSVGIRSRGEKQVRRRCRTFHLWIARLSTAARLARRPARDRIRRTRALHAPTTRSNSALRARTTDHTTSFSCCGRTSTWIARAPSVHGRRRVAGARQGCGARCRGGHDHGHGGCLVAAPAGHLIASQPWRLHVS